MATAVPRRIGAALGMGLVLALIMALTSCSSLKGRNAMADLKDTRSGELAATFDAHVKHEFVDRDVDATMRTMVAEPYLLHLPTLTGGVGAAEVRRFYERYFVGKWPADTMVERVSRTVGWDQVVDELILSFTHDVPLEF